LKFQVYLFKREQAVRMHVPYGNAQDFLQAYGSRRIAHGATS